MAGTRRTPTPPEPNWPSSPAFPTSANRVAAAAKAAAENDWAAACLARAKGRLHHDTAALAESIRLWEHIGARFERDRTVLLLPDPAGGLIDSPSA